jgi:hypothetical protein
MTRMELPVPPRPHRFSPLSSTHREPLAPRRASLPSCSGSHELTAPPRAHPLCSVVHGRYDLLLLLLYVPDGGGVVHGRCGDVSL